MAACPCRFFSQDFFPADRPPYLFFCWSHVRSRDLSVRSRLCQIVNTVVSCSGARLYSVWNCPHVCGRLISESRLDDGLVCVLLNAVISCVRRASCPSDVCDEEDSAWAGKGQDSSGLLTFLFNFDKLWHTSCTWQSRPLRKRRSGGGQLMKPSPLVDSLMPLALVGPYLVAKIRGVIFIFYSCGAERSRHKLRVE